MAASVEVAGQRFIGYAERAGQDDIELLFWPAARVCQLDSGETPLLPVQSGRALGYSARAGLGLLAGGDAPGSPAASVAAFTFDGRTGVVTALSERSGALSEPRAEATITAFGNRFLVAGGENPLRGESEELAPPSATADVFDPITQSFQAPIALNVDRSRHAAIELASGDTLLVGGRGPRAMPLNVLELVSVASGRASIAGLTTLEAARLSPSVLKLDDGRLFVGGGTAGDGSPLAALEWLSGDARRHLASVLAGALPPRHDRAFVALPGGGVLAVGGCQASEVPCGGDCRAGCPPADPNGVGGATHYDAWWISEQGTISAIDLPGPAPRPLLFGGADGAPLLATGASDDSTLWRFDPWQARFEPAPIMIDSLPRAGDGNAALAAQAALWMSERDDAHLFGLRWGTRDRFAIDPTLVTSGSADGQPAPFPLVPDRPSEGHVRFQRGDRILIFDGESDTRVFVASAAYGALAVELWVEGEAPRVILGEREYGGEACPWPSGAASLFKLERDGMGVTLSSGDARSGPCAAPSGRARLGFGHGAGSMVVRRITIERRADAAFSAL